MLVLTAAPPLFAVDEEAVTLAACPWEAFAFFGGAPQRVLLGSAGTVVIELHAGSEGRHRWHGELLALADAYGFAPKLCRLYQSKTKGEVERFNGYLKGRFLLPLAATLKQCRLLVDAKAASAHVGRWLTEVSQCADTRHHRRTTGRPAAARARCVVAFSCVAVTIGARRTAHAALDSGMESLQHPLSLHEKLLGVAA